MNSSGYNNQETHDFLDLVIVLAKKWRLIAIITLAVMVLTATYSLFIPNVYTAKTMIVPKDDNGSDLMGAMMSQIGGLANIAGGGVVGTKGDLYVTVLNSESIKDLVIERYNLKSIYKEKFRSKIYAKLDGSLDVSIGKKDGVISINFTNENPKLAADIANGYVTALGEVTSKLNMDGAGIQRSFFEDRLKRAKGDLAVAEEALKNFQNKNKAVNVPDQAKVTLDAIAELRGQLLAQQTQQAVLRQKFTEQSAEVKSANASINNLKQQISRLEGSTSAGVVPGFGAMPQLGQEYVRLMRDYKTQETLAELLTKQHEIMKINEANNFVPFQVIQFAKVPDLKSGPKRALIVLMMGVAAFFSIVIFVALSHILGTLSVTTHEKLKEIKEHLCRMRS